MSLSQEITNLEEAGSTLLSTGQKIFSLLDKLLDSNKSFPDFGVRKQKLINIFGTDSAREDYKVTEIKNQLKQELADLDLKFAGGKKGFKSNQELAVVKIIEHLEKIHSEFESLEKEKQARYLETPEGQINLKIENENKEKCRQEVLSSLSPLDNMEKVNQLNLSARHLELAGVYGVELTQSTILNEWKKMSAELLLRDNFATSKSRIKNFQKYQSFTEKFSDHQEVVKQVKELVVILKIMEEKIVLSLADIIANNSDFKEKLHRYGLVGAGLNPKVRKALAFYDDLPETEIADSPAALAYEYLHHLLSVGGGLSDPLNSFLAIFSFSDAKGERHLASDIFAQKYRPDNCYFSNDFDYDPEFLKRLALDLKKLFSILQFEIDREGKNIDPRVFLAYFGKDNYYLWKGLPKLVDSEAKLANFPREYVEPELLLNKKYYEDENIFNIFNLWNKQFEEKLEMILPARWLEEELRQKQQKNPDVWALMDDKIRLVNYLRFLEQNKDYHSKQLIEVRINSVGKMELLDRAGRQMLELKKSEYKKLEESYKNYLKNEIASIIHQVNKAQSKIFQASEKLVVLNDRLGSLQVLSSHNLSDRIFNRINSSAFHLFKEQSLSAEELESIRKFSNQGLINLEEQDEIRGNCETLEKDLNRWPDGLDARFLSEYPDLAEHVSTYENLIDNLKLINLTISSLLREKHFNLIKEFSFKNKEYQNLINEYNRKYNREEAYHLVPTVGFSYDLIDYL